VVCYILISVICNIGVSSVGGVVVRGVMSIIVFPSLGVIYNIRVSSIGGVVMRRVRGIIVLHTLRRGEPELSSSLEAESSSLGDSMRMACNDGDLLWVMPPNPTSKLAPSEWPI
jgi:hypothetical protein